MVGLSSIANFEYHADYSVEVVADLSKSSLRFLIAQAKEARAKDCSSPKSVVLEIQESGKR